MVGYLLDLIGNDLFDGRENFLSLVYNIKKKCQRNNCLAKLSL